MIALTVLTAEHWRLWRELRLKALADSPCAFSSTLGEWQGEGDTERRWRDRLDNVPFNAIAYLDGSSAGMVSATTPDPVDESVALISMWVAPFARGRAIGDALVEAVIAWSAERQARCVVLDVMEGNDHAIALYRRHRFEDQGRVRSVSADEPPERSMVHRISVT